MDLEGLLKKRIKSSDGMYKLFTEKLSGCWVMAQALKKFLGKGELYTIVDEGEVKQIVLKVDNDFVNAGGVRDASKLLKDLKKGKGYVDPHLRSFKATDITEPYPTEELVDKVTAYFKGEDTPIVKGKPASTAKVVEKSASKPAPKVPEKPVEPAAPTSTLAKARAEKIASRQTPPKKG
jgi:hypothetical protein